MGEGLCVERAGQFTQGKKNKGVFSDNSMCGIIAFIASEGQGPDPVLFERMNACHLKRGPDHSSCLMLMDGKVGLGHTRLAILDLSVAANQPMGAASSRQWIVFNGEIYNFKELRRRLEGGGQRFLTHSDTEVLLHAMRRWGPAALHHIEGIFAFVYVDLDEQILIAARDRIGVKPLYWFSNERIHCFSSTLWPLKLIDGFKGEIDPVARFGDADSEICGRAKEHLPSNR